MQCFTIYLFLQDALHVSDGVSTHHQELKTAHTASGIGLTLYVQFWAPDDGQKTRLKHEERLTEINKLWNVASCWLYSANILAIHWPMDVKFKVMCCKWIMAHFKVVSQNALIPTSEQQRLSDLPAMVPELWTHTVQIFSYVTHTPSVNQSYER